MREWIINAIIDLPVPWRVFLLSMLPVTELRVALPLGLVWGVEPVSNYFYAVLGNIVPILPVLYILDPAIQLFSKVPFLKKWIDKILNSAEVKKKVYEKYEIIGLIFFVSIPAPGTGAWTGILLAYLMRIQRWKAFLSISTGVFLVGILMTGVSLGVVSLSEQSSIGVGIIALLVLISWFWLASRKRNRK